MKAWVYFAGEPAGLEETLRFATRDHLLWRGVRNAKGAMIANVRNLRPRDRILLVYRGGGAHVARVAARIAGAIGPVAGTQVVERIEAPQSRPLLKAGYPKADAGDAVEVVGLEDVFACEFPLRGAYRGRNAIHALAPEDRRLVPDLG